MIVPIDILRNDPEPLPEFLQQDTSNLANQELIEAMLASRTVYYPGAYSDGQAFAAFIASHAAHAVIHADYGCNPNQVAEMLRGHDRPRGYRTERLDCLSKDQTMQLLGLSPEHPFGNHPRYRDELAQWMRSAMGTTGALVELLTDDELCGALQGSVLAVLRREDGFDNGHGPERIAFLHVTAEGVWLFYYLWARRQARPYGMILQDHGYGGNWAEFGQRNGVESPLEQVARNCRPTWMLVGGNTHCWPDYERVSEPGPPSGWGGSRSLYKRRVSKGG